MQNSYPHLFGKCDLFCALHSSLSLTIPHTYTPLFTPLSQLLVLYVSLASHTSENFKGEIR